MGERRCEGLAWHQYVGMHVHVVPNRGSSPTVLLRESYREGAKVAKRTLANLSSLSAAQIEPFARRCVVRHCSRWRSPSRSRNRVRTATRPVERPVEAVEAVGGSR